MIRSIKFEVVDPVKLDIGCGPVGMPGWIGIDKIDFGQELVWDILDGIPLPDKSVTEIYSSHFLEHVPKEKIVDLWEEMYRILTPGGKVYLRIPHATDNYAFIPAHVSQWTEESIVCLCNLSGDISQNTRTNFKILKLEFRGRGNLSGFPDPLQFPDEPDIRFSRLDGKSIPKGAQRSCEVYAELEAVK